MAPTKETLEVTSNDATVSQAATRPKPSSTRADAVSLEVPVKVHGTRVKSNAPGAASEPFEETTTTMIVFPQGGVLKMSTPVAAAQMVVVTNLKTGQDAICRVLKVRAFAPGQSYAEIEFTHQKPGYWGVYFPSDRGEAGPVTPASPPKAVAPPIPVASKPERPAEKPAKQNVAAKPAPTQEVPKPAAKQADSVFAQIGSQEAVQPAAAPTSSRTMPASMKPITEPVAKPLSFEPAAKRAPVDAAPVKRPISFAGAGVPGEVVEAPENDDLPETEAPPVLLKGFGASTNLDLDEEQSATGDSFGSGIGSSTFGVGSTASRSSQYLKRSNGAALAIAAAAILAFAAGAAYHFHLFSSGHPSAAQTNQASSFSASSAPPAPEPVTTGQFGAAPSGSMRQPNSPMASTASPAMNAMVSRTSSTAPSISSRGASASPAAETSIAPVEKAQPKAPNLIAALKAHPQARKRGRGPAADLSAPEIDDSVAENNAALATIGGSDGIAPPPGAQGPVRIRVGGAIKPPQLISSVMPTYPTLARETGIDGDVVVDTTIDKTGKVTGMKVISGPSMLRQAATDALKQWKYEPSLLNGDPVPVQMTVTIKFHRN